MTRNGSPKNYKPQLEILISEIQCEQVAQNISYPGDKSQCLCEIYFENMTSTNDWHLLYHEEELLKHKGFSRNSK